MTWIYQQRTGIVEHDGEYIATGYSGMDEGKNNPDLEHVSSVGPIPRGRYVISQPQDTEHRGPCVMRLIPDGEAPYGRSGFEIHGDSIKAPGSASTGCIILPRVVREQIGQGTDNILEVI